MAGGLGYGVMCWYFTWRWFALFVEPVSDHWREISHFVYISQVSCGSLPSGTAFHQDSMAAMTEVPGRKAV